MLRELPHKKLKKRRVIVKMATTWEASVMMLRHIVKVQLYVREAR